MTLSHWVDSLGWTLVHLVWQAALVAALLKLTFRALPTQRSHGRYLAACGALLLMLVAAAVTLFNQWQSAGSTMAPVASFQRPSRILLQNTSAHKAGQELLAAMDSRPNVEAPSADSSSNKSAWLRLRSLGVHLSVWLSPWMNILVGCWAIGVGLLSVRLGLNWQAVRCLRATGSEVENLAWNNALNRLRRQLRVVQPVVLLQSSVVQVPVVIGALKPAILMPIELVTGLPANQIEAILAHELAHIRRHDYFVNLLQNLVETLLFFHPAVWWVSAQVRREREFCCDDVAASLCEDKATYVRALATAETMRGTFPALSVAVTSGSLLERVRRLARQETAPAAGAGGATAGLIAMMFALGLLVCATTFAKDNAAKESLSPAEATSLALRAHQTAAELTKLPRCLIQFTYHNADVTTMQKVPDVTIENLRLAVAGPVDEKQWVATQHILAWDPERIFDATSYSRRRTVDSGPYTRNTGEVQFIDGGAEYFGTKSDAWSREQWDDAKPPRFFRRNNVADFSTSALTFLGMDFFKVTPREFWWGNNFEPNAGHSSVPPTMVEYTHVGRDTLGGELCSVVESKGRSERLWIGRDSGLIRGSLQFFFQGRSPAFKDALALRSAAERIAGRPMVSDEDYQQWNREHRKQLTHEQNAQLTKAWNEDYFDSKVKGIIRRPSNLVIYGDYRQIAPGVMLPFREDRAVWLHEGNEFKYLRSETVVDRVDLNDDLRERLAAVRPKLGDRVQDQRFAFPVEYDYRPDLPEEEIQSLVEAKKLEASLREIRERDVQGPATKVR